MVLRKSFVRASLLSGAALVMTAGAGSAFAQITTTQPPLPNQPPGTPPGPVQDGTVDADRAQDAAAADGGDIIVTAQRRAESVQNVPIAITTLDNEQLQATGIADTETLRAAVPSLNVTTATGGYGLPRIRGIGATGQGPGIENPVAIYVDGIYYGASFGILQSLYDVDQVAVLKGPQGTLFGRNATGGLIQIQTRNPSIDEATVSGQVGYGNYDTLSFAGFGSVPLSSNLAFSVSGQYEDRSEGYGRNLFTGTDVQTAEIYSLRSKLLWRPGPESQVLLSFDANGRDSTDPAFTVFGRNTNGQNLQTTIAGLGGDPDHDIYSDYDPLLHQNQWGTSLTIDQGVGGGYNLKSITAYRHSFIRTTFDPDGTTTRSLIIDNNQYDNQFSQELNLLSPSTGPFKFVAGLYYLRDAAGLRPNRTSGLNINSGNGYNDVRGQVTLDSYSAFAEGTYTFGGATNLTAGIRYTKDDRSISVYTLGFNSLTNVTTQSATTEQSVSFERPSWRLSLDHRFSPELLVYASYNRGFRAGTFVPQVTPFTILQPEEVDAFEVGLKSDLANRRVRINLAGYYFDQSSVQVFQVIAGVQNVYNANGAEIYGVDGDISFQITDHFQIFGGFNYNHARYRDFTDAVISIPFPVAANFSTTQYSYVNSANGQTVTNTTCLGTFVPPNITTQAARDAFYRGRLGGNCLLRGDASGNRLQNTPDITFSVGASLEIPTRRLGTFTLAGNYYYNGGFVGSPDERLQQDSYSLLDASLTWNLPGDHFFVRIYGKNLTDSVYASQIASTNSGDTGYVGAPLTFGALVGFHF